MSGNNQDTVIYLTDDLVKVGSENIYIDGPKTESQISNYEKYRDATDVFYMAKSRGYLDSYAEISRDRRFANILEIGFFRGGSSVFLNEYFRPERLVCVDRTRERLTHLESYVSRTNGKVKVHYGVDQDDVGRLQSILRSDLTSGIDLVIDDASHFNEETRRCFEIAFPFLNRGGIYVIEDWSWAHASGYWQEPGNPWEGKAALTNFVFELIMLHGSAAGLVDRIAFLPGFMYLRRGLGVLPSADFRVSDHIVSRGKRPSLI